jgi:hypothetical protein
VAHVTGIGFVDPPGLKMGNFKTEPLVMSKSSQVIEYQR